ncbi:MAG: thioredoxin domain-containing protein [Pseudomonadota bacterium]
MPPMEFDDPTRRNRLADLPSPHLQAHATQPVNWQPWDEAALSAASRLDKPILLSIGYTTSSGCERMARESYSDPALAAKLNDAFVCIKVDREERPDLDQVFQFAHRLLTQQPGGWPLTMFLSPDRQMPFFGGTYFPAQAASGVPGFSEVLDRVLAFLAENGEQIAQQSDALSEVFRQAEPTTPPGLTLTREPLDAARQALLSEFDAQYGGFGGAPKFPTPGHLDRLLRHWHAHSAPPSPDLQALFMATRSLQAMGHGGLFDHVGGGFFRYCVDAQWEVPHFEKMLGENAQLLTLYAQAWRATGDRFFWQVASECCDFLVRELAMDDGGLAAGLAADSDGVSGASYTWSEAQWRDAAGDQADALAPRFGLDRPANVGDRWHLFVADPDVATDDDAQRALGELRARLFTLRGARPQPLRDGKRLAGWNGLALRSLAICARHLEREDVGKAALSLADFLREQMVVNGRLQAVYHDGKAYQSAFLDDVAFVLDGLLELLQTRFRREDLDFALGLADSIVEHFFDAQAGGFFFTPDDMDAVIHRMKPVSDSALPAGAGVAARALIRLGDLVGEPRYLHAAEASIKFAWQPMLQAPHAHMAMLGALDEQLHRPDIAVIRCAEDERQRWLQPTQSYSPRRQAYIIDETVADLPGVLAQRKPQPGGVAYLCKGPVCAPPVESARALLQHLQVSIDGNTATN